jgi:2-iminobutanoate/2-iminopropanoate deaminase|tara:strand:+ start:19653 stop:20204 length:552 start_codon:yes stop_codon:yes gene_type:complete
MMLSVTPLLAQQKKLIPIEEYGKWEYLRGAAISKNGNWSSYQIDKVNKDKTTLNLKYMKKIITTSKAPAPIGPYNQAVLSGNTLYTSGQIALDPQTGALVLESIEAETKQVMENMKEVLAAAEMTFEHVVKASIFISDMNNFAEINSIYGTYFNEETAPARETVEVANLPKFVNVEISMIAVK